MKRIGDRLRACMASVLALVMLAGLLPVSALGAEGSGFADTAGHWGEGSINRVVKEGLFTGVSEDAFDPDGGMTRAMFVTVLMRLADKLDGPAPAGAAQSFSDVAPGAWYAGGVDWAVRSGVTAGYGNGIFGPDDLVTREQMCVFLVRFLSGYMKYDLSAYKAGGTFADDAAISDWARDAVYQAQALGLVQGVGGNQFNPKDTATRASVAAIADRLLDKTAELAAPVTPTPTPSPSQKPSGGGGGGGGGGGDGKTALSGVYILRDGVSATGQAVRSGDVLYPYVSPDNATYTVRWTVGGVEKDSGDTYTVQALDAGQTIKVEAAGTGDYKNTVTSAETGAVAAAVDLTETDPDKSPVVMGEGTVFKNEAGETISIPEGAALDLSVARSAEEAPAAETTKIETAITTAFPGADVTPEVVAVDVDLTLTAPEGGDGSKIHAVGETTITLSKEALGLHADADLSLYALVASHTNKDGTAETVTGTVAEIGGVQYARFVLNGLSRIYIGNVPPLTVTFDTQGGSTVDSQKVKLGELAKKPVNPTKEGYLFAGWDYDLTVTKIVGDTTVKAKWIQGTYADTARLSVTGGVTGVEATKEENGTLKVALTDSATYGTGLSYTVQVTAPAGAVKYAMGDTAEAAYNASELSDVSGAVTFAVPATDGSGKAIPAKTAKYIKWVDDKGAAISLECAALLVWTESYQESQYDTEIKNVVRDVDRGIGTYEVVLSGEGVPDYVAYLNGNLSGVDGGYRLGVNASVNGRQYISDEKITLEADLSKYTALTLTFTPFAGQSYTGQPTAEAYYWDADDQKVDVPVTAALRDGKLVVTAEELGGLTAMADIPSLRITVEANGKSQNLSLFMHNYGAASSHETVYAETWAGVLEALARADVYNVYYNGTEDATLTGALTLRADQDLQMGNKNLTIGQGGVLTLSGTSGDAASLNAQTIAVASGGVLAVNSQRETQNSFTHANANAQTIVVKSGGEIRVPARGFLSLYAYEGNITVESGATVINTGLLDFNSPTVIAGSMTLTGADLSYSSGLYGDSEFRGEVTVSGSITVTHAGTLKAMGGLTVAEGGKIDFQSGWVDLTGDVHNNGALNVTGGELKLSNVGYSVYSAGTIAIASGADVYAWGTVLVNSGTISGAGTLNIAVADDTSAYDNGIEYVKAEGEQTPSNYSRYRFTHDPAATVEVTLFAGELSSQDGGVCTAQINDTTK